MQIESIKCKLIDGKSISGQLERPFRPVEGEVVIRTESGVLELPLDQICCVVFEGGSEDYYSHHIPSEKIENIVTRSNETYSVRLVHEESEENLLHGFYAIPISKEDRNSRIFFSRTGVLNRSENLPDGKILNKTDSVSQETIDRTVNDRHKNAEYRNRLVGDILMSFNLVSREQIIAALREQRLNKKKHLGEILVDNKIITEQELLMALALKFRMSTVNLDDISPDHETLDLVPADIVRKLRIFPITFDTKKITVATFSSVDIDVIDTLRFCTNRWIEMVLATHSQIDSYIAKYYDDDEGENYEINIEDAISELEIEDQRQALSLKDEAEAAPIVRLANKTLLDGIKAGASDIHLLPTENGLKLSFRINGLLQQQMKLDTRVHKILIARFKIIANMDISEHRLPQDGRFKVKFHNREIEFRVSCMPGQHGENLVLRILDKSSGTVSLEQLGLDAKDVELINRIVRSTHGMLLVTGPTGSGKSTTLASVLRDLVDEPKHMLSLEDPIEINVPGINQIQIHEKIGFTFASALRNVLRHDPDVIMVGEIRDHDTAKIAVQAALTGHVLLSTLHTNNAAAAFSRLSDMGVEPYLVSATVKGVMAQQLLPKLCEKCRSTCEPDASTLEFIASHGIDTKGFVDYFSAGCEHCRDTGISGRVLLYEFLKVNRELQKLVTQEAPVEVVQSTACNHGMRPIVNMALEVSQKGLLSLDRIIPLFIE
ncbi:MAG: GspE/PulE family protein [Planctomycetota bacterium]|jgi:type II secretory ATPase GspE/PulE/Tfp pilus assembly ATPase PilB-like protein